MIAVRGGLGLDGHLRPQYGAGVGIKFGFIGFDIGVATHNNTISGEQGMRFGTSIAFY